MSRGVMNDMREGGEIDHVTEWPRLAIERSDRVGRLGGEERCVFRHTGGQEPT